MQLKILILLLALLIVGCSSYDVEVLNDSGQTIGRVKVRHFLQDRSLDSLSYNHTKGTFEVNKYDTKLAEVKAELLKLLLAM